MRRTHMGRLRSRARYARARGTRMLEWSATTENVFGASAVNTVSTVVIHDSGSFGANVHSTVFRVVGALNMFPTVQENIIMVHFGVYLANVDGAGANVILDPRLASEAAVDQWLWWNSRVMRRGAPGAGSPDVIGMDGAANVPVDIKVKRILSANQRLHFSIISSLGGVSFAFNARMLSKVTGTK